LQLIRHKDSSIVGISRISEVIQLFILDAVKLAVIQQFPMKECNILRGLKIYSDASNILSGNQNLPTPRIYPAGEPPEL